MIIYTIGFTKRKAADFFNLIRSEGIELMVDIRLNNSSQLAGFTKDPDIAYFLDEICACKYDHDTSLSPTKEILDIYKDGSIAWEDYEREFRLLMEERGAIEEFIEKYAAYSRVCLLCSEFSPKNCHRGIVAELLREKSPGWEIRHL